MAHRDPPLWAQLGVTASLFCQRRTRVRHWQKSSLFLDLHPKSGAAGEVDGEFGLVTALCRPATGKVAGSRCHCCTTEWSRTRRDCHTARQAGRAKHRSWRQLPCPRDRPSPCRIDNCTAGPGSDKPHRYRTHNSFVRHSSRRRRQRCTVALTPATGCKYPPNKRRPTCRIASVICRLGRSSDGRRSA